MNSPVMFNSNGPGKAHPLEKVFRWAIIGIVGFGAIKLFNAVAPTLIDFFKNLYIVAGLGLLTFAILWFALSHRGFIWMTYKNICRKITEFFISIDFLSYIDSYIEILGEKLQNLQKSKDHLSARYNNFQKNIEATEADAKHNLKLAEAAKKIKGQENQVAHYASMAATSKKSLERLLPVAERMEKNLQLLDKLEENWTMSIDKLKHEVKIRRTEYEHMRDAAKTLGNIEGFMRGDSEEARIFYASLQELDNSLADKVARIEAFEKRSKNMMNQIDLEKQMNADEGMLLLQEFEEHGSAIFLPTDYSQKATKEAIEVKAQVISSKPLSASKFDDLLK